MKMIDIHEAHHHGVQTKKTKKTKKTSHFRPSVKSKILDCLDVNLDFLGCQPHYHHPRPTVVGDLLGRYSFRVQIIALPPLISWYPAAKSRPLGRGRQRVRNNFVINGHPPGMLRCRLSCPHHLPPRFHIGNNML